MLGTASPSASTSAPPAARPAAAPAAAPAPSTPATRGLAGADPIEALARAWATAWSAGSPIAVGALCTSDVVLRDPVVSRELHGQAEVATFVRRLARSVPDLRYELVAPARVLASGQVLVAWRITGHFALPLHPSAPVAPGRVIALDGVSVWHLRDGRVAETQSLYDIDELLPPVPPALPTSLTAAIAG
jgi:steroid delta-isomerase-like uncharacterized protein